MALCSDCSATHCFSANASARTPLSWYLSFCSLGHVPMLLDLIIFWATLGRMAATPAMPSSETGLKVLQGFNRTLYSQLTPRASIKMLTAYTQLRLVHRNLSDHCSFCSVWQQQSGPPAPASHRVDAACTLQLPEGAASGSPIMPACRRSILGCMVLCARHICPALLTAPKVQC